MGRYKTLQFPCDLTEAVLVLSHRRFGPLVGFTSNVKVVFRPLTAGQRQFMSDSYDSENGRSVIR
jgi:hypothetical protein